MEAAPAPANSSYAFKKIREIDPSTAFDQDIVDYLREMLAAYKGMEERRLDLFVEVDAGLAQLDPWDPRLRHYVIPTQKGSSSRQTRQGYWKAKDIGYTGIRLLGTLSPEYTGLRMTYEFHIESDTKTNWLMYEYSLLEKDEWRRRLVLQDDLVFRKVFHKNRDRVPYPFKELDRFLNNLDTEEEYNNGEPDDDGLHRYITSFSDCLLGEDVRSEQERSTKILPAAGTKSGVWQHFTKIHNRDPNVVFAVCHYCDKVFTTAHSSHGTSHLRRHSKKCSCKHQQQSSS